MSYSYDDIPALLDRIDRLKAVLDDCRRVFSKLSLYQLDPTWMDRFKELQKKIEEALAGK